MIIGAIGEWIVGNTFPFVVFGTFGKLSSHVLFHNSTLKSGMADLCSLLSPRRLLAHLWRHTRPVLQRIRRLRHNTRTNGWTGWKSGEPAWTAGAGFQC